MTKTTIPMTMLTMMQVIASELVVVLDPSVMIVVLLSTMVLVEHQDDLDRRHVVL